MIMTDQQRGAYYATLPEYYHLEELRSLILNESSTQETILEFLKNKQIPVNSYVKGMRPNEWVPLLHIFCRSAKFQNIVKFLIKSGVKINLMPDANKEQLEPLLFICDEIYFKYLFEHGCRLPNTAQEGNIKRRLRCADAKRLRLLVKVKQLKIQDIISGDPILYCFTSMKEYLEYAFNIRTNITNLTEELNSVIAKFTICIEQLIEWGAPVTEEAVKFAVNFYLYEFLSLPAFKLKASTYTGSVPYHEFMDKLQVAMLRPLLNDSRYEKTCKITGQQTCKELWTSAKDI